MAADLYIHAAEEVPEEILRCFFSSWEEEPNE